jgi:hypothetical protein
LRRRLHGARLGQLRRFYGGGRSLSATADGGGLEGKILIFSPPAIFFFNLFPVTP